MNRKFAEKLAILLVLFLGVCIATGFIIGNYSIVKKEAEKTLATK